MFLAYAERNRGTGTCLFRLENDYPLFKCSDFHKEENIPVRTLAYQAWDTPVVGFHAHDFACNRFCTCRSRLYNSVWTLTKFLTFFFFFSVCTSWRTVLNGSSVLMWRKAFWSERCEDLVSEGNRAVHPCRDSVLCRPFSQRLHPAWLHPVSFTETGLLSAKWPSELATFGVWSNAEQLRMPKSARPPKETVVCNWEQHPVSGPFLSETRAGEITIDD